MPPFPFLVLVPLHSSILKISEWSWICSWRRWYGRFSSPSSSPKWWRRPPSIPNPFCGSILFLPRRFYFVLHHELLPRHISRYTIFIRMPPVLFNILDTVDYDASDNALLIYQRRFVLEATSGLMSPIPFLFASLGYGLWKLCLFVFLNLCVRLLRPASLTWGMDRQTHERLWISGVTGHRADSLDKPGSMFRLLCMSPQTSGNTYYEEPIMTCVL